MPIVIKNKNVREDILNEKGEKIGEITFNPNDSAIMKALAEIITNLTEKIKKIDKCKSINIPKLEKTSTAEEFEAASEELEKLSEMLTTEYDAIDSAILSLEKILGRDTVECFTGGTHDIELLIPLIEFMTPYIQKSRTEKVEKYIGHSNDNDVME